MSGHVFALLIVLHLVTVSWTRTGLHYTSSQVPALLDHPEFFLENQPPPSPSIYELCANDLDYEECLSKRECERKWFGSSSHCKTRLHDSFWKRKSEPDDTPEQLLLKINMNKNSETSYDENNQTTPSTFTEKPVEFG